MLTVRLLTTVQEYWPANRQTGEAREAYSGGNYTRRVDLAGTSLSTVSWMV